MDSNHGALRRRAPANGLTPCATDNSLVTARVCWDGADRSDHSTAPAVRSSMSPSKLPAPAFDITVRVGCSLVYEVTGRASLLLNLKPRPDRNHAVIFEALSLGHSLPAEAFKDTHGNPVWRVTLAPGSNCFRHDAIIAVSSRPDNHDLPRGKAQSPDELPPDVLRYTLPSRYCDSDKLANFAWEKFGRVENGLPRVNAISQWVHDNIEYRYL